MRKDYKRENEGKANDGGGGSGLPRHPDIDKRLCITVPEAAAMLGISKNFAYELRRQKKLPYVQFGKRYLIPRLALEKMLENGLSE